MADSDWTDMGKPKPWPDGLADDPLAEDFLSSRQLYEPSAFQVALARELRQVRRDALNEVIDSIVPADMAGLANLVDGTGIIE